jgi:hypothetical protein
MVDVAAPEESLKPTLHDSGMTVCHSHVGKSNRA